MFMSESRENIKKDENARFAGRISAYITAAMSASATQNLQGREAGPENTKKGVWIFSNRPFAVLK